MEKLIELLNEYTNKHSLCIRMSEPYKWVYLQYDENFTVDIISKQFWFIKWLVDNDKINIEEIQYFWTDDMKEAYSIEENLLMLLAIQDNPTEFLISVLN
jgi:hypothetical protein